MLYYVILYYIILYNVILFTSSLLYYTVLYDIIFYCIMLCFIVLYYISYILCTICSLFVLKKPFLLHAKHLSHKKYFYDSLYFRLFTPLSGYFTIESASGRIQTAVSSIDYEEYTSFNLTILATDNGSPPRSIRKTTKIQVVDVNHPPTDLTFNGRSVSKIFSLSVNHEGIVK